jgi:NTP pyrophosphatase (non-canonical NTP hydrolase)
MKSQYIRINKINKLKKITLELGLCKLGEEIGEFFQVVNISLGIKKGDKNKVKSKVKEEASDSIQNIMSICNLYGITFDELVLELKKKNNKWEGIKNV